MDSWFEAAGAAAWGAVRFGGLAPYMDARALARAEELCPVPAGVFVAAFPYYAGDVPGNLSRYARGSDYHTSVVYRLEGVCRAMEARWPGRRFLPGADNSPIPEKTAALLAGLGVLGNNSLVLTPRWGSYVFFGTILTDLTDWDWPEPRPAGPCLNCGRCVAACPGGAIGGEGMDPSRCLSHLTQKKGELDPDQTRLVAEHSLIWGCDRCQEVCPYNRDLPLTPLPEFRTGLIHRLDRGDLAGLTARQFRERYANRAFTWRGPGVLLRNLDLQSDRPTPEE